MHWRRGGRQMIHCGDLERAAKRSSVILAHYDKKRLKNKQEKYFRF